MSFIKNIEHETVLNLADQISVAPGQIVSKTLAQTNAVSITLFVFSKGEEIGTHDSTGDAFVHVLDGSGIFTIGGIRHTVKAGEAIIMPAGVPHSIFACEDFKWLLTVVF